MTTEEYRDALRALGLEPWGLETVKALELRPRMLRYLWNGDKRVSPRVAALLRYHLKQRKANP